MSDWFDDNEPRVRARELGLPLGRFKPGKYNAITDVEGVLVGHSTIIRGSGPLRPGQGPVRTGVTAIMPDTGNIFSERMTGGGFVLNGAGEVSGLTQVMEWGLIETPILLTNTMSVGAVSDAVARYMVERHPGIGDEHDVIIPVVGECDDSWLKRREHSYGSIIAVVATDAPLLPHQLSRLCKRVARGIGRVGSYAAHGSG